ncbi:MAG: hypothetical protein DWQ02_23470 [Bacteroidetes bacterium]|nr:MAG: hypothetical protein DWQ02_23470 [Bacteroidota bacterium]
MFEFPLIGCKWQILPCSALKSLVVPSRYVCVFRLDQNKISSFSLDHGNQNILLKSGNGAIYFTKKCYRFINS